MKVGLHDTESDERLIISLNFTLSPYPNCCSANVVYGVGGGIRLTAKSIWEKNYAAKPVVFTSITDYFKKIRFNGLYAVPYYYGYIAILKAMADKVSDITYGIGTYTMADRINKKDFSCKTFMEWLIQHPEFCSSGVSEPAPGAHGDLCFGGIVGITYNQKRAINTAYTAAMRDLKNHVQEIAKHKESEPLPEPVDFVAALWA